MHSDCCLICMSPSVVDYSKFSSSSKRSRTWNLIDKDLHVIFILRNVFEVPSHKLQNYLIGSGNPGKWGIMLCSRCLKSVEDLKETYDQILKITRRFNVMKEEVVNVARRTKNSGGEGGGGGGLEGSSSNLEFIRRNIIMRETRAFIRSHNYVNSSSSSIMDPFKEGDLLAQSLERLVGAQKRKDLDTMEPVEVISIDDDDNEDSQPIRDGDARAGGVSASTGGVTNLYASLYLNRETVDYLKKETDQAGESRRYICPLCEKLFASFTKLKFHSMSNHLEHLFEGSRLPGILESTFKSLCFRLLRIEISPDDTSKQDAPQSCSQCGRSFKDRRYLQHHWMISHYENLQQKLRQNQENELINFRMQSVEDTFNQKGKDKRLEARMFLDKILEDKNLGRIGSSSSISSSSPCSSPSPVVAPAPSLDHFKCTHCTDIFNHPGKLKEHAVIHHPEQFFPPSQFNKENLPIHQFRTCCQLLFREEKIEEAINGCFSCPMCSRRYLSKEPVLVHLVESHYDHMVLQLLKVIKNYEVRKPTPPPQQIIRSPHPSGSSINSMLTPPPPAPTGPIPSLMPLSRLPGPPIVSQTPEIPATGISEFIKINYRCDWCGTMFTASSGLSRHKNYNCKVRRAAGLLKSKDDPQFKNKTRLPSPSPGTGPGGPEPGTSSQSIAREPPPLLSSNMLHYYPSSATARGPSGPPPFPPPPSNLSHYYPPSTRGPAPPPPTSNVSTYYSPGTRGPPPPSPPNSNQYYPPSTRGPPPPTSNVSTYYPPSTRGPPPPPPTSNVSTYYPPSTRGPPPPSPLNINQYYPPSARGPPPPPNISHYYPPIPPPPSYPGGPAPGRNMFPSQFPPQRPPPLPLNYRFHNYNPISHNSSSMPQFNCCNVPPNEQLPLPPPPPSPAIDVFKQQPVEESNNIVCKVDTEAMMFCEEDSVNIVGVDEEIGGMEDQDEERTEEPFVNEEMNMIIPDDPLG